MALPLTQLDSVPSTSNAASYLATAGITPVANRLILVALAWSKAATPDLPSSVVGYGITFTRVNDVLFNTIAAPTERIALYHGVSASPTNGTLTVTFPASQTGCYIISDQVAGLDIGGTNGSNAIVQSATNRSDSVAISGALNATLAAFGTGSGGFVVAGSNANPAALNPKSGWFQDRSNGYNTPATGGWTGAAGSAADITTTDNAPGIVNITAAKPVAVIGVELKMAAAAAASLVARRPGGRYVPDLSERWWSG